MTCTEVRAVLPLWLYGEPMTEEKALREHLAHCSACRREHQAFAEVRQRLDTLAVPPVAVDLSRLHAARHARQTRALRRWRRIAVGISGVAALLLLTLGLRLEVRWEARQLVVRWGEPPPPVVAPTAPPIVVTKTELPPETEAELRILSDLIHALKQDVEDRDRAVVERLDRLNSHLRSLESQADRRWNENKQDVAALYLLSHKGEKP